MTCGIYSLTFPGYSNKTYIGRSNNIERRFKEHLAKLNQGNHPNHKIQKVYKAYNHRCNFRIELKIIIECDLLDLPILEQAESNKIPRHLSFNIYAGVDEYYAKKGWRKKSWSKKTKKRTKKPGKF